MNFIYRQYCYQLYYSYFFCCFVEIKKIPLWSLFLIVYLHLQWNAVLTQIMLCLAEAVLRNSRYFCMNPYWISTRKVKKLVKPSFKLSWEPLIFQQNIYRRKIPQQCYRNWPNLSRQLEWGLQEKCFKVLKAVQDAFFHFFSMLLNGAYASKFETGWEPWVFMVQL